MHVPSGTGSCIVGPERTCGLWGRFTGRVVCVRSEPFIYLYPKNSARDARAASDRTWPTPPTRARRDNQSHPIGLRLRGCLMRHGTWTDMVMPDLGHAHGSTVANCASHLRRRICEEEDLCQPPLAQRSPVRRFLCQPQILLLMGVVKIQPAAFGRILKSEVYTKTS